MSDAAVLAVCFCVMCLGFVLFKRNKYSATFSRNTGRFFKALATFSAFVVALHGLCKSYSVSDLFLCIGLMVCTAADVILDIRFVPGMGVFALGHLMYSTAYVLKCPPGTVNFIVMCVFMATMLSLIFRYGNKLGRRKPAFALYAMVLSIMLSLAITQKPLLLTGAALFVSSDLMLARNMIFGMNRKMDYLTLAIYYLGQFLIATSVVL